MLSQIKHLYKLRGGNKYAIDEPITQISHAIQTSLAIKEMGGDREMQTAGLLHDIGHLLSIPVEPDSGIDDKHEFWGGIWLKRNNFPERVYKPITMHVDAKRYLCSKEWGYYESLSRASKISFKLQGGWMGWIEKEKFEDQTFFKEAIMLRRADDVAKKTIVPDIEFDELLESLMN